MPPSLERKIICPAALAARLAAERAGRTVVQCHGCFDIVHPGHVRYLQFARRLGDMLIVSLTGDAGIGKGLDRPYIPEGLRAENLAALEFVDWVVIDPHPTACELLAALKPDVYVKGREYAASADARFLREREIVEGYGGRVVFHSGDVVFSSTRLIESLDGETDLAECRARAMCEAHGIDLPAVRAALAAMNGVPALVVGDVLRERYVLCDRRESGAGAAVLALEQVGQRWFWGGAAAQAMQLAALGARVTLISGVSRADDEDGGENGQPGIAALRAELAQCGVTSMLLPLRDGLPTCSTFLTADAKVLQLDEGPFAPLDTTCEKLVADATCERLAGAALLVWSEHGCGALTPGLIRRVTTAARDQSALIAAAAGGTRGDLGLLRDTDLLVTTERRLRSAAHDFGAGLPALAWRWLSQTDGKTMIVALHRNGLLSFDGRGDDPAHPSDHPQRLRSQFVPPPTDRWTDTLGYDDALLATAALACAAGAALPIATYLAGAAGAIVAARGGRTSCSADELATWVETRPELRTQSRFLPDAASVTDIARLAPPLALAVGAED